MTIDTTAASHPATARDGLLGPYLTAVALTAITTWLFALAMQRSAAFDLTGQLETLLPLARLGVISAPLIVALRGGVAAVAAWLVAGALGEQLPLRRIAAGVFLWLPLLELPALVDAGMMLLDPQADVATTHVALGLDAWLTDLSGRARIIAQTLHPGLVTFTALLWRHLRLRTSRGDVTAIPAAVASAAILVLLPLLRS